MDPIALYNDINQYARDNGMVLTVHEPGHISYTMTVMEKHLSSPNTCHGGVLAGLMDSTIGTAALSLAFTQNNLVSTVEFKMNYFLPVHLNEELIGTAKVDYHGKSLMVSSGEIRVKSTGAVVAKGMGTFNVYPFSKKGLLSA